MRGQVGQKRRLIQVTEANLRNGHLYLTGHLGFFPAACFGSSSKKGTQGQPLTLEVAGLKAPVLTDIPTEADGTEPRKFFRNRAWVPEFLKANKIKGGDFVMLEKLDRFHIRIAPAVAKDIQTHLEMESRKTRRREIIESKPKPTESGHNGHKTYRWPTRAPRAEYNAALNPDPRGLAAIQRLNWRAFRTIDLFAGIGGIRQGFQAIGGMGVFASEWDQLAAVTYEANFGEKPHGDITKIDPSDIPDHDILLAGFPCQPFSIIGAQKPPMETRVTPRYQCMQSHRAETLLQLDRTCP